MFRVREALNALRGGGLDHFAEDLVLRNSKPVGERGSRK
jgi:hypothetical protein